MKAYVDILRNGGVVACATETFFGLLADASNPRAIERVLRIKKRPAHETIALLLPSDETLSRLADEVSDEARSLARTYWPGPLTLVVRAKPGLHSALVKDGNVGVRVPGPSPALDLVRAFGGAVTATSANRAGEPPAETETEVIRVLGSEIDAVVPGVSPGGLPSTIVDVTEKPARILRQGAVVFT